MKTELRAWMCAGKGGAAKGGRGRGRGPAIRDLTRQRRDCHMHMGTRHTCGGRTVPESDIQRGNVTRKEQPVTPAPSGPWGFLLLAWSAGPCVPGRPEEGAAPAGTASLWAPLSACHSGQWGEWSHSEPQVSVSRPRDRDHCDSCCTGRRRGRWLFAPLLWWPLCPSLPPALPLAWWLGKGASWAGAAAVPRPPPSVHCVAASTRRGTCTT